jgi:hypothetical protein
MLTKKCYPGTIFSWRFRYRLQADYTFAKETAIKSRSVRYSMFNVSSNKIKTPDQNRIYITALHFGLNSNIAFELGYLNSFQRRAMALISLIVI